AEAGNLIAEEELGVFLNARNHADVLTLDVEEQRTRNRILSGANSVEARGHAIHRCHLETVTVLVVETQAEHTHRIRLSIKTGQGFSVITSDFDDAAVTTQCVANGALVILVHRGDSLEGFATSVQNFLFEDLTRTVVGSR